MDEKRLKEMMERFFDAELTAEEERALYRWLRENDVPAELRNDKEAIIALCSVDADIALPAGAVQRLETMLDGLAEEQQRLVSDAGCIAGEGIRRFKIPRPVIRVAVAAAVLLAIFMAIPSYDNAGGQTDVANACMAELPEEDTFDNPEDAMRCFKLAFGDMQLAMNAARNNTCEIGDVLEKTINPHVKLLRLMDNN